MKLYPESADLQLEFDKVKILLKDKCRTEWARKKADHLRVHTRKDFIELELRQSHEFSQLSLHGIHFPNDYILNLNKELKLLSIPGAMLSGEEITGIRRLALSMEAIFRWFNNERRETYPGLAMVIDKTWYDKSILESIDTVMDETGYVRDQASKELASIRLELYRKRNELRRVFEKLVSRLNKQGYLAEIEESFMNGRRVLAVFAEQKRQVKGILHGESDSRRTSFIEPEETMELNNEIYELEHSERQEVYRILRELTAHLSAHHALLSGWHQALGIYDFIRAKALLAADMGGQYPLVEDKAQIHLVKAYHPLLWIYNKRQNKPVIPLDLTLDEEHRILVISGPNAGGKTVSMKTVGLLQMMVQSGLLVPVNPSSRFGIFKQVLIHIGDTQSLEFELSTYSSHLLSMKHFMENANGKTLFFIDELGSGSDPNLGGAFAEVIMEELARKHAYGIVTTHYLNLKVMANKTPGIMNGAMAFDESSLMPLYQLVIGKPGSSYTFSIAERIGLEKRLIQRARKLVEQDHFKLDKLLNKTEQDLQIIQHREKELHQLIKENEKLKKEMEQLMNRERHVQQVELLKAQSKMSAERLTYLKDMERKLKQIIIEWKKSEDKNKVIKQMAALLFHKNEEKKVSKKAKQLDARYEEVKGDIRAGDQVKMRKNMQVGTVLEVRGRRAIVKIGLLPMQIDLDDLSLVRERLPDIS